MLRIFVIKFNAHSLCQYIDFQLEACYLESQNKASKLQKELLVVREQLASREREVEELTKELATVREELMIRYVN